jgi:S-adenosylmethionine:tRNA ribosyltransferase-isomerase
MRTSDFDYDLPVELIAQSPVEPRDSSRLMVLTRHTGAIEHRRFHEIIDYLEPGDVLVFNDSRVIPARLKGRKMGGGAMVEILLLRRLEPNLWEVLARPGKRLQIGSRIEIAGDSRSDLFIQAEITRAGDRGTRVVRFSDESLLFESGEVPLPPYIHTPLGNLERYQTVYARVSGSVAAPTAGLHFTPELIYRIERKGVECLFTTLHVGLDTFQSVKEEDPLEHTIHKEYGVVERNVANRLSKARCDGRKIICVGSTSVRIIEQAARASRGMEIEPFEGWTDLFILPGHKFRLVDAMITNYHLPRSTLLMLVTAFAGRENIERAYREAIARKYRFYSFGDAMLIL